MTLVARSCPTCHSIGDPRTVDRTLGSNEPILCRNPWHDQDAQPAREPEAVTEQREWPFDADLPNWVLDLVADLLDEEDVHPKLFRDGAQGFVRYDWCPAGPLERVPDEVKMAARVIQRYRPKPPEDGERGVQHCTCELVDVSTCGWRQYVDRAAGCPIHRPVADREAAERARETP